MNSNVENPRRKNDFLGIVIFIICIVVYFMNFYGEVNNPSTINNVSTDTYTFMLYVCGSNLESDGGYATSDIEEMLKSKLAKEVNVLIYTGGAKTWYDYGISNKTNQIYKIEDEQLLKVKDNIGKKSMAEPDTLKEFLDFAYENYKADRYGLIFWDHGGGAISGFGNDENISKNDSLTIDEIKKVVDTFPQKFEFIGFDACLMANFETAYALKENANYLIASEETEPGTGWDYISFFNGLSKDTSQDGAEIGRIIVDSFIASNSAFLNPDATLSTINLSKIDNVYEKLETTLKEIKSSNFDKNNYASFSKSIVQTKSFAEGDLDTFDLVNFAQNLNINSKTDLINAVNSAVSYNKTNQYVENSNGMSIYIPKRNLQLYDNMIDIFRNIGIKNDYINVLSQYANIIAGGSNNSYVVNQKEYSTNEPEYSSYSWYDSNVIDEAEDYYDEATIDITEFEVTDKDDYFALELSKEDWKNIDKVESVLWYDDGKGYIDMGSDTYFETDGEGDLKIASDGTWLAINGQNVYYKPVEIAKNYEKGIVPAILNGNKKVNVIIYFDAKNPDGIVLGTKPDYAYYGETLYEKGIRKLKKGDTLDFVAPYYFYDGTFKDEYYIGDKLTVGDKDLKVSYEYLGDGECLIYYKITDLFGNIYYTEKVILE